MRVKFFIFWLDNLDSLFWYLILDIKNENSNKKCLTKFEPVNEIKETGKMIIVIIGILILPLGIGLIEGGQRLDSLIKNKTGLSINSGAIILFLLLGAGAGICFTIPQTIWLGLALTFIFIFFLCFLLGPQVIRYLRGFQRKPTKEETFGVLEGEKIKTGSFVVGQRKIGIIKRKREDSDRWYHCFCVWDELTDSISFLDPKILVQGFVSDEGKKRFTKLLKKRGLKWSIKKLYLRENFRGVFLLDIDFMSDFLKSR